MIKILSALFLFAIAAPAFSQPSIPIDSFYEVSPGIYRGARPGTAGLEALKQMGVKTILNIDSDDDAIAEEAADSRRLGLNMISIPLSGFWSPHDEDVDAILGRMNDASLYPVFVHCEHGHDRTGMVVGLFRIFFEEVKPEAAYQEALDLGFHRELFLIDHYFRKRAGLD